jgi:hypothetical protein
MRRLYWLPPNHRHDASGAIELPSPPASIGAEVLYDAGPSVVGPLRWYFGRALRAIAPRLERLGYQLSCVRLDPRETYVVSEGPFRRVIGGSNAWSAPSPNKEIFAEQTASGSASSDLSIRAASSEPQPCCNGSEEAPGS